MVILPECTFKNPLCPIVPLRGWVVTETPEPKLLKPALELRPLGGVQAALPIYDELPRFIAAETIKLLHDKDMSISGFLHTYHYRMVEAPEIKKPIDLQSGCG